jgi:hypothetical protein
LWHRQRSKKSIKTLTGAIPKKLPENCKAVKVMALDEARFGLINWHKRGYGPKGIRPTWTVRREYEWTWLYAAIEPATGQGFCLSLPRLDGSCYEVFLKHLSQCFPEDLVLLIQDNAPAQLNHALSFPKNIIPIPLPAYSPELNPVNAGS